MQFCKYTRSLSLMFSNLRWSMKSPSTRYAMRDTQVHCSKKMLQISSERDGSFCLQPLTFSYKSTLHVSTWRLPSFLPWVTVKLTGKSHLHPLGRQAHGHSKLILQLLPILGPFLLLRGMMRGGELAWWYFLTQNYHPQTLNWLRSYVQATMTFGLTLRLLQSIRSLISKTFPRSVFWNVPNRAPQHPFTTTPINR